MTIDIVECLTQVLVDCLELSSQFNMCGSNLALVICMFILPSTCADDAHNKENKDNDSTNYYPYTGSDAQR